MAYYVGIDAGGSKTHALVTDEHGHVLGKGQSGNGNHQIDAAEAARHLTEAAAEALQQAGIHHADVAHAYFGLAGADRETDFRILRPIVSAIGFPRFSIACDTIIGLRAGTDRSYGISVICGTGTNCAGRNKKGEQLQVGGFTYMYGDFGGGGALNEEVFRSVIRAWDGREQPTLLTGLLLARLGYTSVEDMFNDYLDHNKRVPVDVTKLLFTAAAEGDAMAIEILNRQGVELGKSAAAAAKRLGMGEDTFDVVLTGSLVTRGDTGGWIRGPLERIVHEVAPHARIVTLTVDPVFGAIWAAMEEYGLTISTDVYERMRALGTFDDIQIQE
ncbi:N-acetylglucosamine kinase-like BadF-type ATPase [Paenibacillus taihuensis]|uniref:N-acetylglucosamine kinase-like BadF-type ATPase n=1 Tax=Paenibacillus taihuensis TaxID=1156355 RepID=A0A3D9SCS4_9BACL|nr:BadF/BadG/BcrA/BcrD ATPase family protein [Paenibacillus taihuensis]REE86439.1 N-acetylglucosamine kinase-like BadF-type ATPase [Paenibacillus taihuensis]